jgi:hypothetical protein
MARVNAGQKATVMIWPGGRCRCVKNGLVVVNNSVRSKSRCRAVGTIYVKYMYVWSHAQTGPSRASEGAARTTSVERRLGNC